MGRDIPFHGDYIIPDEYPNDVDSDSEEAFGAHLDDRTVSILLC